jgi:hypothetical protein
MAGVLNVNRTLAESMGAGAVSIVKMRHLKSH